MPASRPPWWFYILAVSFLGFFALQLYVYMWGTEEIGFDPDYSTGFMIVQRVYPTTASARAGLLAGDRIVRRVRGKSRETCKTNQQRKDFRFHSSLLFCYLFKKT